MPVHYCSLHKRLLSGIYRVWVDFPLEKIQAIKALYELFHGANIETSAYKVSVPREGWTETPGGVEVNGPCGVAGYRGAQRRHHEVHRLTGMVGGDERSMSPASPMTRRCR